jgi:RimJ/RimL family protein N-acetyltransferase
MAPLPRGEPLDFRPAPRPSRASLAGRHVLVRPLDAGADADALYAASHPPTGDPAIWTYLFEGPYESSSAMRRRLLAHQRSEDPLFFTLAPLPENRPLGMASYLRIVPAFGVLEIGNIWFGPAMQRTAAATEAIYLLARHAFDELGYRRLEWKCDALNAASRRAAVRFGFTFEGVFRQHMVVKGRNRDTAWYAIIDRDWPALRAGFERWLAPENFDGAGRQRHRLGDLIRADPGGRSPRRRLNAGGGVQPETPAS